MEKDKYEKQLKKLNIIIESIRKENIFLKGQVHALLYENQILKDKKQILTSNLYYKIRKTGGKILRKLNIRK